MSLEELYQEVILDHYKKPRCKGCLANPSAVCSLFNPLCGDQVDLSVTITGEQISEVAFSGHGCSISQAAASMMSELCQGKTTQEATLLCSRFKDFMRSRTEAEQAPELGDALALQGVRKFSARIKCAVLAWEAMEKCLEQTKRV